MKKNQKIEPNVDPRLHVYRKQKEILRRMIMDNGGTLTDDEFDYKIADMGLDSFDSEDAPPILIDGTPVFGSDTCDWDKWLLLLQFMIALEGFIEAVNEDGTIVYKMIDIYAKPKQLIIPGM